MNKSIPRRLKSLLYPGLCLFLLIVTINSCKKDSDTRPQTQDPFITEAKSQFDKLLLGAPSIASVDVTLREQTARMPIWNQAYTVSTSLGKTVFVPLSYTYENFIRIGKNQDKVYLKDISYLLLYKDKHGVFYAEVITRFPDEYYWDEGRKHEKDFSGLVIIDDWWGKALKTYRKNAVGKIENLIRYNGEFRRSPGLRKGEGRIAFGAGNDCISTIEVETNRRGMYEISVNCEVLDESGFNDPFPEEEHLPDFGSDRGSPGPELGPGDSGSGGYGNHNPPPPPLRRDIVNNLPEGCLKNVVNELIQKDCKNELSYMINQIFNVSSDLDLVIGGRSTFSNDIDGDASTQLGVQGYCKINIDLNTNILPDAAKEYIAATMFHESIHAYLAATARMSELDHQVIAETYISRMAAGIQELYPSISLQDAEALAWGGPQKTSAWIMLQSSDPAKVNMIIQTNNNYRRGQLGNICNPR